MSSVTKTRESALSRGTALALVGLALAAFLFVTAEILPIGLLPQISAGIGAGLPATGLLVSVYAFSITLAAVPLTAWTARLERRNLLLLLVATLLLANVGAALAASYALLLAARLVNAAAHAVFWSIAGSCAVRLVPQRAHGIALAAVFGGNSIATVCGVPAATFVGEHLGWRAAFWAVAGLGAIVFAIVASSVHDRSRAIATGPGDVRALLAHGAFRSVMITTVLVVLGQFVAYTFIVPYVEGIAGFPARATAPMLLLFGAAGVLGNFGAGAIANRNAAVASLTTTAFISASLLALSLSGTNHAAALVALAGWGFGTGGLSVGLQTRVLALAPAAPDLASSLYNSAFNIGIGGGSLLGGGIVAALGLARAIPLGAGLALLALAVQLVSLRRDRGAPLAGPAQAPSAGPEPES